MFYFPNPHELILPIDESHHAIKVLRHKAGDRIQALNGEGTIYTLEIQDAHPKKCSVHIVDERKFPQPTPAIEIAVAPPKSADRLGFLVEKLVEVGVSAIILLETHHSERRKINLEKLNKVALSAAKQCGTPFLPLIDGPQPFTTWASECQLDQRFIATADLAGQAPAKPGVLLEKGIRSLALAIGPEGDFSTEERAWAETFEFKPVSLGRQVLRTETAAVAAAVLLNDFYYT